MKKRLRFYRLTRLSDILLRPNPGRTKVWCVRNIENGVNLGKIMWFGAWRQYAFDANSGLTFEKTCLRAIADFCERHTKLHYATLRQKRKEVTTQ